jgi:hypothetical protein
MNEEFIDYLLHRIGALENETERLTLQNELLTAKLNIASNQIKNG